MSELMNLIIKEITENKTINEICDELNISKKKLYYYLQLLKNKGFVFKPNYCSNGEIKYNLDCLHSINMYNKFNDLDISMESEDSDLKTLVISDLHFGNELERRDIVDMMFDYCIKNNIHIILCCGDLLDGTFSKENQKIENGMEQIEYFIKNYPHDKTISTLTVLGDHDFSILRKYNYDPAVLISRQRHDIGIGGYNYSTINIKNDKIQLHHQFNGEPPTTINTNKIVLHGHYHKYNANISNQNILHINVPPLCDILTPIPSALEMNLKFKKKNISAVTFKQLMVINNTVIELNEIEFKLKGINLQAENEEAKEIKKKELCL